MLKKARFTPGLPLLALLAAVLGLALLTPPAQAEISGSQTCSVNDGAGTIGLDAEIVSDAAPRIWVRFQATGEFERGCRIEFWTTLHGSGQYVGNTLRIHSISRLPHTFNAMWYLPPDQVSGIDTIRVVARGLNGEPVQEWSFGSSGSAPGGDGD